jgi:hypothetical protein
MPYSTVVSGTTITAAWGNANVRDQVVTPFATAAARTSAITSPVLGMLTHRADLGSFGGYEGYGGAAWLPAGTQLIATSTLGAGAATVTFSSIPATYSSLLVMGLGSLTGAGTGVDCTVTINSDTGANYSNHSQDTTQAALNPTGAFNSGQANLVWAFSLPGTTYNANRSGGWWMKFPGYSNTTFRKIMMSSGWMNDGGTSFNAKTRFGWWNGTAAISTLLFTSGAGNFSTGNHIALYGMP